MSTALKISAQPRSAVGRNAIKSIKAQGYVPGIVYGRSTKEGGAQDAPQPVQFKQRDVDYLLGHAASESVLVEVDIAGSTKTTMLQEVQHHPVTGKVMHLDLHSISMEDLLETEIPIEATGESAGVKTGGGVLQQSLRVLEIECLPGNLPEAIVVDVSGLEIGASLHVRDLKLPNGVKALNDPELTVFAVTVPTVGIEPTTTLVEPAPTEPEVIREKKPEGEEAEAPAKASGKS